MTAWLRIGATVGFICLSVALVARSQNPVVSSANSTASDQPRYVLSVDVDLVSITATVIDGFGRSMENLTAEDFRILEDGQEQKISFFSHDSHVPISVGFLIDTSGSLQDKLRQGLQTVRELAATLASTDEMFVITFNSHVDVRQRFTNNPDEIQRSLSDIHAHGETAVFDAISAGLSEMRTADHQKRILILVSDGFDTKSRINAAQAEDLLKRSDVLLYAIGIDDDDNDRAIRGRPRYHIYEYMLNKLANAGGGRVIRLYTGRDYDLHTLSESFLRELHQEYTMGYYPSVGPDNAGWRNIEVHLAKPGARVFSERLHLHSR
jgi:Ca-activated chloride channel family protein